MVSMVYAMASMVCHVLASSVTCVDVIEVRLKAVLVFRVFRMHWKKQSQDPFIWYSKWSIHLTLPKVAMTIFYHQSFHRPVSYGWQSTVLSHTFLQHHTPASYNLWGLHSVVLIWHSEIFPQYLEQTSMFILSEQGIKCLLWAKFLIYAAVLQLYVFAHDCQECGHT